METAVAGESTGHADVRIKAELAEACGQLNLAYARLVDLARQAADQQVNAGCTLAQWLSWQTGLSSGHVRQIIAVASARDTHPQVAARFDAGTLTLDQASMAATTPPQCDRAIAEVAPFATVPQLRVLARAARLTAPRPLPTVVAEPEELSITSDGGGRLHLRGLLDVDHGKVVDAAVREARDALFHAGNTRVTWAEALVEVAQRSLDAVSSPDRRERFRSYLFIDPARPIPASWDDGVAVPDWLLAQMQCDGSIAPVYVQGGLPVSVSRRSTPRPSAPGDWCSIAISIVAGCPGARRRGDCRSTMSCTASTAG